QVMIVGVSHLQAKRDVHNSVYADSPLSPKRQAQIDDVVRRLAQFRPTKVLIEEDFGDKRYTDRYRDYLAGRFTLGANEVYQYGFKLAARSGDKAIYPIDADGPAIIDDKTAAGKQINAYLMKNFLRVKDPQMDAFIAHDQNLQLHGTYLDELRYLNTDEAIRANAAWYSIMAGMGRESGNAGAAYVSQWYGRNCYIFSNILSVIRPGDRVVVIMGQGHEYLLREFVRLNPNLTYVNALHYLH
ncbi:MAG TPA: DUF5694 domain-containing protein, partial [Candidatus Baltobacteraceae bacterium]|nr:DUF5694 domain-containing protein [Candidatus Baltobacteraceae bacterium]